jgi:hypothetical protein
LRYLASRSRRFALWRDKHQNEVFGYQEDFDKPPLPDLERVAAAMSGNQPDWHGSEAQFVQVVENILATAGAPVIFRALVDFLSEPLKVVSSESDTSRAADALTLLRAPEVTSEGLDRDLIVNEWLRIAWNEITRLHVNERRALLLTLDASSGASIYTLVILGIVTIADIARALEMDPTELARIWHILPLDDEAMSENLGISRAKVVNLRRTARRRLRASMREYGVSSFDQLE